MVVAQRETAGDALGECAEVAAHALAQRLKGLEAGGTQRGVDADAFGGGVIDGDEDGGLPLAGEVVVRSVPHIMSTASGPVQPRWHSGYS
jgi:hypothetical protein